MCIIMRFEINFSLQREGININCIHVVQEKNNNYAKRNEYALFFSLYR